MYAYNRRQYIYREPEKKNENPIPKTSENNNFSDLKVFTTESVKLLSENINEMKDSIKKLEDKINDLALRLVSLENHIEPEDKHERLQSQIEINTIKNEPETPKNNVFSNQQPYPSEKSSNLPLMPGSGFSNVTLEYLKNISNSKTNSGGI
jgi:predicted nuclease with TOPRIM domain